MLQRYNPLPPRLTAKKRGVTVTLHVALHFLAVTLRVTPLGNRVTPLRNV